jgi:hypothetical protein
MDATLTTTTTPEVTSSPSPHPRLAELVVHLTGCPAPQAVAAVSRAVGRHEPHTRDDQLSIVAEALVAVKRIDLREKRTPS